MNDWTRSVRRYGGESEMATASGQNATPSVPPVTSVAHVNQACALLVTCLPSYLSLHRGGGCSFRAKSLPCREDRRTTRRFVEPEPQRHSARPVDSVGSRLPSFTYYYKVDVRELKTVGAP